MRYFYFAILILIISVFGFGQTPNTVKQNVQKIQDAAKAKIPVKDNTKLDELETWKIKYAQKDAENSSSRITALTLALQNERNHQASVNGNISTTKTAICKAHNFTEPDCYISQDLKTISDKPIAPTNQPTN